MPLSVRQERADKKTNKEVVERTAISELRVCDIVNILPETASRIFSGVISWLGHASYSTKINNHLLCIEIICTVLADSNTGTRDYDISCKCKRCPKHHGICLVFVQCNWQSGIILLTCPRERFVNQRVVVNNMCEAKENWLGHAISRVLLSVLEMDHSCVVHLLRIDTD